jgi:hypothetical protein
MGAIWWMVAVYDVGLAVVAMSGRYARLAAIWASSGAART